MDLDIFKEPEKRPEGSKKSNIIEIQRYIRKRLNDLGLKQMVIKEMKKEEKAKVHKKRKAKLHSIEIKEYDDNYNLLGN